VLNILVTGGDGLLDISLVAALLDSGHHVFYAAIQDDDLSALQLLHAASETIAQRTSGIDIEGVRENIASRLHWSVFDPNGPAGQLEGNGLSFDQMWYCPGGFYRSHYSQGQKKLDRLRVLLSAISISSTTKLNYINTGYEDIPDAPDGRSNRIDGKQDISSHLPQVTDCEVRRLCAAQNIPCRIFHTCAIIGEIRSARAARSHAFPHFLAVLDDLKNEIEERFSEYFEFQALRCLSPPGARIKVLHADDAVERMMETAWPDCGSGGCYFISSSHDLSLDDLCQRIGNAYDLNLFTVADPSQLNAVDRLFHARTGEFAACMESFEQCAGHDAEEIENITLPGPRFNEPSTQFALFRCIRRAQDASRVARAKSVAQLANSMERKTLECGGSILTYFVAGAGPTTVVIINALGQGLGFWYRLIHLLSRNYRVVIWELRGTVEPPPQLRLEEQVDDMEAIIQAENITACHLLSWCGGAKIAAKFQLRHPSAVLSIVFLNPALKYFGGGRELDSAYEHNLESLFRVLDRRPEIAASVMDAVRDSLSQESMEEPERMESETLATRTLARVNQTLKAHMLREFQSEASTLNYARQALDFWSHDFAASASRVDAPVLVLSAEYDRITSPECAKNAAQLLPRSHYIQLPGATHYSLYDSPSSIAELVENFFQCPG
jgi:pimeloyl-ACP methyl ester carboxylesterase